MLSHIAFMVFLGSFLAELFVTGCASSSISRVRKNEKIFMCNDTLCSMEHQHTKKTEASAKIQISNAEHSTKNTLTNSNTSEKRNKTQKERPRDKGYELQKDGGNKQNGAQLAELFREILEDNSTFHAGKKHDNNLDVMKRRMLRLGHSLGPVFSRLNRRASFRKKLPLIVDERVVIGRARVAKRFVTPVGDIDGNGIVDFIITDPTARNNSGKARLFFMTKSAHYLSSRELVPGSKGFDTGALKSGDRYGTAVLRLPGGNSTTGSIIAISAPGDGTHGSVYVLRISSGGDVVHCVRAKIRKNPRDGLIRSFNEWVDNNRATIHVIKPAEEEGPQKTVGTLSDVERIVFEAPDGEILATLAVDSSSDSDLLNLVESEYLLSTSFRYAENVTFPRFSVKIALDSDATGYGRGCHVNSTHCSCDAGFEREATGCLHFEKVHESSGQILCSRGDCPEGILCKCDGKHICKRKDANKEIYVEDEEIRGTAEETGKVYCKKVWDGSFEETVRADDMILSSVKEGSLDLYNETHCLCSKKSSVWRGGKCLRYSSTSYGLAIYCKWQACEIGNEEYQCDNFGSSYCKRDIVSKSHWMDDGAAVGLDVNYCHLVDSQIEVASLLFDV